MPCALWVFILVANIVRWRRRRSQAIKPLVYTARVKRLLPSILFVIIIEALPLAARILDRPWHIDISMTAPVAMAYLAVYVIISQLVTVNIILGNLLVYPVEASLRAYYVWSARRKIQAIRPVVIGITGSYGKTSTKEILAHMLSSRYNVLRTPKSYNTLMGICRVIREDLQPRHEYFVVELGAYKPGEIARLCKLVQPRIGILTAVGPQHLERFKTIDNVARAKYELIQALPPDGVAIFNADDPNVLELSQRTKVKALRYSTTQSSQDIDAFATNLQLNSGGTSFVLTMHGQECGSAHVGLLGRHNISNILAAALAAEECGMTPRDVIRSVAVLPQVEHRLQAVTSASGITYIDDAYNSNPVGASMALEVLAAFEGRKMLVTPGLVELGALEVEENAKLGRKAAGICDYVFLVGDSPRTRAIHDGLVEQGFDPGRSLFCDSLQHAKEKMGQIVSPGDVILFENDLPDVY